MPQYINKDALVAKIDELVGNLRYTVDDEALQIDILDEVSKFINTLEVKEVDLENEVCKWLDDNCDDAGYFNQLKFAKHFFELGLKASNVLTWEDMKQIRDIMVECSAIGLWSKPDEEYYQEVVKRFKAQKGE